MKTALAVRDLREFAPHLERKSALPAFVRSGGLAAHARKRPFIRASGRFSTLTASSYAILLQTFTETGVGPAKYIVFGYVGSLAVFISEPMAPDAATVVAS